MTRVVALPYLTADPARIAAGPWMGIDAQPLDTIPDWDYSTDVHATRAIELDLDGIREDCQLGADARLALTVVWRSTRTGMRGAVPVITVPRNTVRWSGELRVHLEGAELGGELRLISRLLLAETAATATPLAPDLVGAILWQDQRALLLEGGAARFPMEVIDFRVARLPAAEAAWYLDWPRNNLHEPVLGAMRLYLNGGHPTIRALVNGELVEDLASAVLSAMRYDVARVLIIGALEDDEFIEEPSPYGEGSVGATLRRFATGYWPDQNLTGLRNHLRSRPDSFNSELQERLRLLQPAD